MSSRAEPAPLRLPLCLLLILTLCTGILLVHFIAEDLAPLGGIPGQAGPSHLLCEHADENFVSPRPSGMPADLPAASPVILAVMNVTYFSISPLLPPPNL
jgi:hypothetical protein